MNPQKTIIPMLILLITSLLFVTVSADELYISPSYGSPGSTIQISVNIYNDVNPDYYYDYYGLEYKIVWDVRPADIINPNLWGYDNPIGTAYIDYNGQLTGTATIPTDAEPGTYNVFAAYQRSSDDPYHMYWVNTFTVEQGSEMNSYDSDGDGFNDDIDDFPYDQYEWIDSDNDGYGDNSDPYPYDFYNDPESNTDDSYNSNPSSTQKNTPGFELLIILGSIILITLFKNKRK